MERDGLPQEDITSARASVRVRVRVGVMEESEQLPQEHCFRPRVGAKVMDTIRGWVG